MSPDIVAADLVKIYKTKSDEVQALRGLSLHVGHAQMVSIIGPSGSGKTTLLNILGGLDTPTGGMVKLGDIDLQDLKPGQLMRFRQKNIGHVLQGSNLFSYLTAEENVELPMLAAGASQAERKKRAAELLESMGLSNRSSHRPDELSGGEKQRVAIASALANDPPTLLADEPTGELDTVNASIITDILHDVSRRLEKTIVLVTHDPRVAQKSDAIFVIEDGRIRSTMTPSETSNQLSYADGLKSRIVEIDDQILVLDGDFRQQKMTAASFTESRRNLEILKNSLKQELQRLGSVA